MITKKAIRSNKHTCHCGTRALFRKPRTGRYIADKNHHHCQRCWNRIYNTYK